MRPLAPHTLRRLGAACVASALVVAVYVASGPASAAPLAPLAPRATSVSTTQASDAESQFFTLMNQARANAGLPAVQNDSRLADTSRSWSTNMGSKNQLYHDPNLAAAVSSVEPNWRSAGENVGVGYSAQSLHDAFMASTGHRANILSSRFNRAGVGVVFAGGKLWVTVRFIEGPALAYAPPPPPPPPPPGVPTSLTGDFNADGFDDVLTYGPGTDADELWFGQAGHAMRKVGVTVKGQYRPVTGDFDGDGLTNILWYAPGTAPDSIWEWNGTSWTSTSTTINGTYTVRAGDFDADGIDDVLWYAPGTASDFRWYGTRSGSFSSVATTVDGSFIPVVGDFDGSAGDDVFWYGRGSATDAIWYSTAQRGAHRSVPVTAGGSHTPFAGDFDGNGVDDVFFYTAGTAADSTWFNTASGFGANKVSRAVNGTYVPGAGDFDANGVDDALWFSPVGAAGDPLWWGEQASTSYSTSSVQPG